MRERQEKSSSVRAASAPLLVEPQRSSMTKMQLFWSKEKLNRATQIHHTHIFAIFFWEGFPPDLKSIFCHSPRHFIATFWFQESERKKKQAGRKTYPNISVPPKKFFCRDPLSWTIFECYPRVNVPLWKSRLKNSLNKPINDNERGIVSAFFRCKPSTLSTQNIKNSSFAP